MQKIVVTRQVFPQVLERLNDGFEVQSNQADVSWTEDELADRLADCDAVLATALDPMTARVIERAAKLRVLSSIGVGYNNIDLAACKRAGVIVTNTPGVLDETTADLAWALILTSARQIVAADRWLRAGHWQGWRFMQWLGTDVNGATLSILGMGRIGQAIARRASGFGMRVLYHNRRRCEVSVEQQCKATYVTYDALLRAADFLVLSLPYSSEVHHLIDAQALATMKPSAHVINIGRGGLIDEEALIEALKNGRLAGAGLDVFENEPALDARFLALDNVALTPHIGSASLATRLKMAMLAVDNLLTAMNGREPPNRVA